jgi:UDP-GlcNAc:undecaprenyl-phosphate GlcNAc-1-phosphate transferase
MYVPDSLPHKKHARTTPLVGGWVLLGTLLLVIAFSLIELNDDLTALLSISLFLFVFGLLDDRFGLSAPVKLFGQLLSAIGLILMGIQVELLPMQWEWVNIALTIFWVVGITNAYNFVDSMDGLALGLAVLAAGFYVLAALDAQQVILAFFSAALLGACLGIYLFNTSPARMFLGDAGAQWLGFLLAGIGIIYVPLGYLRSQSWFVPILLMGVPVFDTTLVVISRIRRGLPIYKANLDHTYHRIIKFGIDSGKSVTVMHLVELLLGCLAFILIAMPSLWSNLTVFGLFLLSISLIFWLDKRSFWP